MTWALLVFTLVSGGFDVERAGTFTTAADCWALVEQLRPSLSSPHLEREALCVEVGGRRV